MFNEKDLLAVNTLRTLSVDQIEAANSGHPGLPMGAAPMAYALWAGHLNVNAKDSGWLNRDRFILSAGHGSALLYSLLHIAGFDVSIDDLKNFRQLGSKTLGHPEVGHTHGVEVTSSPLGQGIATAVGMAMAEAHLGATYNTPDFPVIDHYTYALCGDGDLMEGVAYEACSLAGKLQLGKLVVFYDSNDISLDGDLSQAFVENVKDRFEAQGWHYLRVEDGNDLNAISAAIEAAKAHTSQPTIIEIKTVIGFGSIRPCVPSSATTAPKCWSSPPTLLPSSSMWWICACRTSPPATGAWPTGVSRWSLPPSTWARVRFFVLICCTHPHLSSLLLIPPFSGCLPSS